MPVKNILTFFVLVSVLAHAAESSGMVDLPARQVHLDFHTFENLTEVGGIFSQKEGADYPGPAAFRCDYTIARSRLASDLVPTFTMHTAIVLEYQPWTPP